MPHLFPRCFLELQRVTDILEDGHMGVERITLEDHADIPILRSDRVDDPPIEHDLPMRGFVNPSHHEQGRRFSTSRRPKKGNELRIVDIQIDRVRSSHIAPAFC